MAAPTTRSRSHTVFHTAAGYTIAADRLLPGFPPALDPESPDICVHTTAPPHWDDADGYHFEYRDHTQFWIDARGRNIWCTWQTTLEDACTYLAGSVLGLALRARGDLAIHASAVVIDGRALLVAGSHGCGKSTTAAAFGTRGYDVLADDVVRLARSDEHWIAHPYTSMLRLWPDSEQHVLGTCDNLPRIVPSWEKRALHPGAHGVSWASRPAPLGWVVVLGGPGAATVTVCVAALPAREALLALSANSSAAHAIGADVRAREFEQVATLVRTVPCATIESAPPSRSLDATVDAILAWVARTVSPHA
jgi:hypothetical protein